MRPRPRIVDVSYWLWLGACLVGVITAAVTLPYFGELQTAFLSTVKQVPGETPAMREQLATTALATLIGAGVLVVLVQLAFAIAMHAGRGWARFVIALLTLLDALYSVAVFGTAPTITQAGLLTTTVLMVIAVVPMFLPDARAWFAQQHLARAGGYDYTE